MLLYCESTEVKCTAHCTVQAKVDLKTFTKTEKLPCLRSPRHQTELAPTNLGERGGEDVGGGEEEAALVHQLQCFCLHKSWDGGAGCDLGKKESVDQLSFHYRNSDLPR